MKSIKAITAIIVCLLFATCLAACGSAKPQNSTSAGQEESEKSDTVTVQTESATEQSDTENKSSEPSGVGEGATGNVSEETSSGSKTLVVVFSATGTTKGIAERIVAMEDADFYEITAAQPYTSDDLNYNDSNSRTTKEQNDKSVRPEISSETIDLSGYTTIYIGYPIWWGEEPRIMDTFVESYDFGDITMIPFCTSGGSGIGRSGSNLADNAGSGNWKSGDRLQSNISNADLQEWVNSYK